MTTAVTWTGFALTALGVLVQYGVAGFYVILALTFTGTLGDMLDRLAIAGFAILTGAALRLAALQLTRLIPAKEEA